MRTLFPTTTAKSSASPSINFQDEYLRSAVCFKAFSMIIGKIDKLSSEWRTRSRRRPFFQPRLVDLRFIHLLRVHDGFRKLGASPISKTSENLLRHFLTLSLSLSASVCLSRATDCKSVSLSLSLSPYLSLFVLFSSGHDSPKRKCKTPAPSVACCACRGRPKTIYL